MKTIKNTILLALFIIPISAFGQYGYTGASSLDVNGIFIGGKYTKSQVVAKWGNPTNYWSGLSEFGLDEEYEYSNSLFRFSDDGVFHYFYVDTLAFVVLAAKNGGVKVGDVISKLSTLGLGVPVLQSDGAYRLGQGDDPFLFGHSNGKITWISYTSLM